MKNKIQNLNKKQKLQKYIFFLNFPNFYFQAQVVNSFNEWRFIWWSVFDTRTNQMVGQFVPLVYLKPHSSSFHKVPFWREEENICQWTIFYAFVPCCFLLSFALRLLLSAFLLCSLKHIIFFLILNSRYFLFSPSSRRNISFNFVHMWNFYYLNYRLRFEIGL